MREHHEAWQGRAETSCKIAERRNPCEKASASDETFHAAMQTCPPQSRTSLVGNRLSRLTGTYVREGVPDRGVRGAEPPALGPRSGKFGGF